MIERLSISIGAGVNPGGSGSGSEEEAFGLDCHNLSLEDMFVDEEDHSKIVRPPSLLHSSLD